MTTAREALKTQEIATRLRAILDAPELCASFTEIVEALAMVAAENADRERVGSVNETSWSNACSHLFDLAQVGRLYRAPGSPTPDAETFKRTVQAEQWARQQAAEGASVWVDYETGAHGFN